MVEFHVETFLLQVKIKKYKVTKFLFLGIKNHYKTLFFN